MNQPTDPELEQTTRLAWAVYVETVRRLGSQHGLSIQGVGLIRRDLRPGGIWQLPNVPATHRLQAVALLHDVATLLASERGEGFEAYYRAAGDLIPTAPDDASSLDPPGGQR